MKTLYKVNVVLLIINILLGITIYFGLMFMIVLGSVQVLSSIWLMITWKEQSHKLITYNSIYLTTAMLVLATFYLMVNDYFGLDFQANQKLFYTLMILSSILAIFFVRVLHLATQQQIRRNNLININ